jgi:hypothetical protein
MVGETPLRIYAKKTETIGEIIKILSQSKTLLDANATTEFNNIEKIGKVFEKLGFTMPGEASRGLAMLLVGQQAWIGDEVKKESSSDQGHQTPDAVRIAGAKAFAATNSVVSLVEGLAAQCEKPSFDKQADSIRGQILKELVNICNSPDLQAVTLENNVSGNSSGTGRNFFPLSQGIATFLGNCLKNEDNAFSSDKMQELAQTYGHEFVEQQVQTAYKFCPVAKDRSNIEKAYKGYCTQTKQVPIDFDGLLFNGPIRTMLSSRERALGFIESKTDLPSGEREELEAQAEQNFQKWLNANKKVDPDDGSITIDIGHRTIMVNADQLEKVTLKSLNAL